jgi:hypothetical protein
MTTTQKSLTSKLLMASILALGAQAAWAQTSAAKPAAVKPAAKVTKAAPAPAPAAPAITYLSPEQRGIAQIVTTGRIQCADGQSVTITPDQRIDGAFDLQFGKVKYDVQPKPTSTGAVRLEDPKSGIVFMQLANKSMLFNEKLSRRLADECMSPAQQQFAEGMKTAPPSNLLGALPGTVPNAAPLPQPAAEAQTTPVNPAVPPKP